MFLGILPGYAQGWKRDIGADEAQIGYLRGEGNGDATCPRANIGGRAAPRLFSEPVQRIFHESLGFRPGDQSVWGYQKVESEELPMTQNVGQRDPAGSLLHKPFQLLPLLHGKTYFRMGQNPGSRPMQYMRQEQLRIQVGGFAYSGKTIGEVSQNLCDNLYPSMPMAARRSASSRVPSSSMNSSISPSITAGKLNDETLMR